MINDLCDDREVDEGGNLVADVVSNPLRLSGLPISTRRYLKDMAAHVSY